MNKNSQRNEKIPPPAQGKKQPPPLTHAHGMIEILLEQTGYARSSASWCNRRFSAWRVPCLTSADARTSSHSSLASTDKQSTASGSSDLSRHTAQYSWSCFEVHSATQHHHGPAWKNSTKTHDHQNTWPSRVATSGAYPHWAERAVIKGDNFDFDLNSITSPPPLGLNYRKMYWRRFYQKMKF